MNFDIYQLDGIETDGSYESEEALEKYHDDVLEKFSNSPEGKERLKADPEMGFWVVQFIYYGFNYIGITLPQMEKCDVDEILTDLFPRKISLQSPDDDADAIPELLAFWQFLKREYNLPNADIVLKFLHGIEAEFKDIMNDTSNFGMAKSFMTMGQSAGFDMTDQEDMNRFMQVYNENILSGEDALKLPEGEGLPDFESDISKSSQSKKSDTKKKKLRKVNKASRKKNKKNKNKKKRKR